MRCFLYTNLAIPQDVSATIRPLKKLGEETDLFPIPEADCFPVLPENLLVAFCQRVTLRPAFLIQSADYPLWNKSPHFISEQEALLLAKKQNSKLFHDAVSNSTYFCYQAKTQHMVWVEDGFHLLRKMQLLQKNGIAEVALPVYPHNVQTVLTLLQCLE